VYLFTRTWNFIYINSQAQQHCDKWRFYRDLDSTILFLHIDWLYHWFSSVVRLRCLFIPRLSCQLELISTRCNVDIRIYGVTFHKITIFSTIYILFDSHWKYIIQRIYYHMHVFPPWFWIYIFANLSTDWHSHFNTVHGWLGLITCSLFSGRYLCFCILS
jgi:hypothetical protein